MAISSILLNHDKFVQKEQIILRLLIIMKKAKQDGVMGGDRGLLELEWVGKYLSEKKFFGAATGECLREKH